MSFTLLTQIDRQRFKSVQLVATDMDGTLTLQGKFSSALVQTLEQLQAAGILVVIVTGRSAGWVSALAHYLPIAGAIAENGGIFFPASLDAECWLVDVPVIAQHRQQLAQMFEQLTRSFPDLKESTDNRYRLTDWTFDVQGLSTAEIGAMSRQCQEQGWSITYSTVQVHMKLPQQNKATGLLTVLQKYFPDVTPEKIVSVGDSPNDESLFDRALFPLSIGVANVQEYGDRLIHHPTYITSAAEAAGFCQLAEFLLNR